MKRILAITMLFASLAGLSTSAAATDWVLGIGSSHFNRNGATGGGIFSTELHSDPFFTRGRFSLGFAGVATLHSSGDVFVGAGLSALYDFHSHWFLEGSVAPGYFAASRSANSLGSAFEIRSLLGLGYELDSGDRVSLAVTHKSNAGTSRRNPGVNSVLLRYRHRF